MTRTDAASQGIVRGVTMSPDGRLAFSCGDDKALRAAENMSFSVFAFFLNLAAFFMVLMGLSCVIIGAMVPFLLQVRHLRLQRCGESKQRLARYPKSQR